MKNNNMIIGVIVAIVIIVALFILIPGNNKVDEPALKINVVNDAAETAEPVLHLVEIGSSGFFPKSLSINSGDSVKFINKVNIRAWPASAIHPTHTLYPGSNINKCDTDEKLTTFDACGELRSGESYSFMFDEVGSWTYHDHLDTSRTGTIIVS